MKKTNKLYLKLLLIVSALTLSGCVDYSKYPHIGDEVEVLKFYKVKAESVAFADTLTIVDQNGEESTREYNGHFFVEAKINLKVNNSDDAKPLQLDSNDFKLKDHVGISEHNKFITIEAFEDYSWCGKTISKGESFSFTVAFQFKKNVELSGCTFVLETDFSDYPGNGVDIVLSENAIAFQQTKGNN